MLNKRDIMRKSQVGLVSMNKLCTSVSTACPRSQYNGFSPRTISKFYFSWLDKLEIC